MGAAASSAPRGPAPAGTVRVRCGSCRQVLAVPLPGPGSGSVAVCCPYCCEVTQLQINGDSGGIRPGQIAAAQAAAAAVTSAQAAGGCAAAGAALGAAGGGRSMVVACPGCERHLVPPAGAPRFRCPCGRVMQIDPAAHRQHMRALEQHHRMYAAQQQQRADAGARRGGGGGGGGASQQFVRCPRCSIVLQPPPGAPRFRCPCGIVLSAAGGSWICNLCRHTNPGSLQACVGCGNQKFTDRRSGTRLNASLPSAGGGAGGAARLQRENAEKAFRLRRANQLNASKKQWVRKRDAKTGATSWVRNVDADEAEEIMDIDVGELKIESAEELQRMPVPNLKARLDALSVDYANVVEKHELVERILRADRALEGQSVSELRATLIAAGVEHDKHVEKKELVRLVRRQSMRQGAAAQKSFAAGAGAESKTNGNGAWVRQLGLDGTLSWVPATEAKLDDGVAGTRIGSQDLEGAAGLAFDRKIVWFQDAVKMLRVPRTDGVVKIQVRRDSLLADTFQVFSGMRPEDFRRVM